MRARGRSRGGGDIDGCEVSIAFVDQARYSVSSRISGRCLGCRVGKVSLRTNRDCQQDLFANSLRIAVPQVLQGDLAALTSGLHVDLGETEHPGKEGALQVDALNAFERGASVLPKDHTTARLNSLRRDAKAGEAPAQPGRQHHDRDDREYGEQRPQ